MIILFILYKIYKKKFPDDNNLGIIISKEKYTIKNDYFKENIGRIIKKDDVIINGMNEHLFVFEARRSTLYRIFTPVINGYIEINDNNVIIIYKKPVGFMIMIALMIIFIGIMNKNILGILIVLIIFGGIALFLIIIRLESVKSDINFFINYGK